MRGRSRGGGGEGEGGGLMGDDNRATAQSGISRAFCIN